MQTRYIVALEVASSKIKGAIASMPLSPAGESAPITIEAIEETPTPASAVQYGRIQNIGETSKAASFVIKNLEDRQVLKSQQANIVAVNVSIGGRSLASEKVKTELTLPQASDITDEHVQQLLNRASLQIAPGRDILAIIPTCYEVDKAPQVNPVGAFGDRLSGEFTVVTCNTLNKRNLERVVDESLKLTINNIIICPLAEADLVLTKDEKQIGCVFVDMGAETTTVAVYKNSALQHLATLPLGSRHITRDIMAGLGLTEERADALKRTKGNAIDERPGFPPGSEDAQLNNYLRARVGEIVANIGFQISASGYQASELPGGCVVVGSGARLRNFNTLLEGHSKLKVRTGTCGPEFRLADGSANVVDNIDILAIINSAARTNDYICVETAQERAASGAGSVFGSSPSEYIYDNYDPEINIDATDIDLIDTDEAEKIKRNRKEQEDRLNELNKQKQKQHEELTKSMIGGDAPLDDDGPGVNTVSQSPRTKKSFLNRFSQTVQNIFTEVDNSDSIE